MKKDYHVETDRIDRFDERWYKIMVDGKPHYFKNVNNILEIKDKGYGFKEWLKNVGHNSDIILDKTGRLGNAVHDLIEFTLRGEKAYYSYLEHYSNSERERVFYWERFLTWAAFWKEFTTANNVEWKDYVEYIVYDLDYNYAGTVDLLCRVNGEPTMFDLKTGSYIGEKEELQQIAYMNAVKSMHNVDVGKAYLMWMPTEYVNKKGYRLKEVDWSEHKWELFKHYKALHDEEWRNKKPKFMTYPTELDLETITNGVIYEAHDN